MLFLIFLYVVLSKIALLVTFLTCNRLLRKLEIGKPSFMLSAFILDHVASLFLFAWSVNFFFLILLQSAFHYFLFQWFKNYNLIGLTGTIGSGKSTLVRMIRERNKEIAIIDCDKISAKLFGSNQRFIGRVKAILRKQDVLDPNGNLDKRKIAAVIFDPQNKNLKRNYLTWVYLFIFAKVLTKIFRIFYVKKFVLGIVDAPTLFESFVLKFICFPIITIYLDDEEELIKRIKSRDATISEEDIKARIRNQMPTKHKLERSDVIICNNASVDYLYNSFITEILNY